MGDRDNNKKRVPFIKRYWWGLLCTLLLILSWYIWLYPTVESSSRQGGFYFFAEVDEDSSIRISNAPKKFRIFVRDGNDLGYYKDRKTPYKYPYPVTVDGRDLKIDGIKFIFDEEEIDKQWTEEPYIAVEHNKDGSFTVIYARDTIGRILLGKYQVKDNVVVEHHYEQRSALAAIIYTIFIVFVYTVGVIIRLIVRFARKKMQNKNIKSHSL
jgi:4-amino-4-deoxy-L-arabinose transferase-like glycosyltransferase